MGLRLPRSSGVEKALNTAGEIPDSTRGNPLGISEICTLFTRYALVGDPKKSVPTQSAEGVKTFKGEYLVELHWCSPHILWLH